MKKGLFALVVLGAIAGSVAYKIKKNQKEKELLDEELEILSGVEQESEETQETSEEDSEEPDEIETIEEPFENNEEIDEEVTEYDFTNKLNEESVEIEEDSNEENISEEIIENPFIEAINEDYKKELEINVDEAIEKLDENNDIFEDERPIQHIIDFKSIEDMEAYKEVVIEKGYVVTRGENPYQLSVLHIAPINKSELLVNVYYLANQAIKHNGSYQGWQSRKVL